MADPLQVLSGSFSPTLLVGRDYAASMQVAVADATDRLLPASALSDTLAIRKRECCVFGMKLAPILPPLAIAAAFNLSHVQLAARPAGEVLEGILMIAASGSPSSPRDAYYAWRRLLLYALAQRVTPSPRGFDVLTTQRFLASVTTAARAKASATQGGATAAANVRKGLIWLSLHFGLRVGVSKDILATKPAPSPPAVGAPIPG